jgi:hypothetical protein
MADVARIRVRLTPIAQAIPRWALFRRVEVLSTLRKHGTSRFVTRPSRGDALHHCSGSGYDLILEVSPAPQTLARCHS